MRITSSSFSDGQPIPERHAFCKADPGTHLALSDNLSPPLAFAGLPAGTASLVLSCVDPDAPSVADDVNQEGRRVAADLPRADFVHWVLIDVPPDCPGLEEGACSNGVTPRGKRSPVGPGSSRQGHNDYTHWFEGDAEMGGRYLGYDGPAPPWNDERMHHYHFRLYALDLQRLPVDDDFSLTEVRAAMSGHVLAQAELVGCYSTNPALAS